MITCLTSITGRKDYIMDEQVKGEAKWIAYLDQPFSSNTWEIRQAYDRFKDPRRNSRAPKILSHKFTDTEFSVYIDGNMSLLKPPEELVAKYLVKHDIAVFKHPKRDCIYGEALKCATAHLDDPEVIIEQVSTYERAGYAKNKGLCECGVIIRRHTPKVIELNNAWWAEYCRHSVRDQISFMYAVDSVGIRVNMIDAPWEWAPDMQSVLRSDFIKMVPHTILNPIVK